MAENTTIKERIIAFGKCNEELTLEEYVKGLGASYNSFKGKARKSDNISSSVIAACAEKYPHLNLRWLLLGEDDMESKPRLDLYTADELITYIDDNIDEFVNNEKFAKTCDLIKTKRKNDQLEREVKKMKQVLDKLTRNGNGVESME